MQGITIITGGGSGIGRALTHRFCAEGHTVLICGRHLQKLSQTKQKYPDLIHILRSDISMQGDRANIKNYVEVNGFSVNYLIHNAAVLQPVKPLMDMNLAEWRDHQAVNVEGPLFLTQTLLPHLKDGRILHISSGAAHHAYQGWGAYCTSKAALYMIYQVLKDELKKHNIRIGSIRPGIVDTPMQDEVRAANPDVFPELQRFVKLKNSDQLIKPQAVADFIFDFITTSDDTQFSEQETDYRNFGK